MTFAEKRALSLFYLTSSAKLLAHALFGVIQESRPPTLLTLYCKGCINVLLFILLLMAGESFALEPQAEPHDSEAKSAQIDQFSLALPPTVDGPVVIDASFQLLGINNVNDKDENFEFVGILSLKWNDKRLAFDAAQVGVSEKIYQGDYQINEVFNGWSPQPVLINSSGLYEVSGSILRVQHDGIVTLTQMINAIAEVKFSMRRLPFDHQQLQAVFGVLGFKKNQVVLRVDPAHSNLSEKISSIDQWTHSRTHFSTHDITTAIVGSKVVASSFVVNLDIQRKPFFMVRLVIFPLAIIVLLTLSVFWMDRVSIGDRINICFVGILTAVAYQIVLGDRLPQISYVTFINGFLNIGFFIMSATVVVNLVIGNLDKAGNSVAADIIERRCRWIFPVTYLALVLLALGAAFVFF